ncbi:Ig-like domain-containing protein [Variovorax boronicumulans]|uniref:Ig-like domain-containing protein n=1 Tax=Variovorax boronicumulans TaxID=436515 RepID=UPI0012E4856F|nr:Ig-like domain-containing protein [Variovorax boronicumulans]GER17706.1 hypothetical protein VCH24_27210 [Variovorax boronicumulans]
MATKKTKVVVNSNGRNIDHTVEAAANGKAPVRIKVQKGAKYLLKGDDGFAPENVTLTRVGNDLQITLEGETSPGLVLEGYYAQSEPVGLYGVAEDGQLYAYARTDGAGDIYALAEGQSAPVALGGDSYGAGAPYLAGTEAAGGNDFFGGMLPLLMTGGLAALGLGAIAAASGSDGDTAPSLPPVLPPPDVRPPGKPGFDGIGGAYDDVGPIKGQIQPGGQTDDTRPDFFGTGTPGNTITMYDNGKEIGKTLVDGNGAWHFTPPKDLSEGNHSITITESDPAGREGEPSDPFEFAVDTTPPPKPEWDGGSSEGPGAVIDDVGPIKGRVPPGGATDDQRPEFNGQGTPGDTIIVQDHGKEIGRVEVNGDGVWTFTPPTDLSEGEHSITIVERDPAGNESEPSDPFDFVVDITPPAQPQVGGANDNMGEYQGPITPGGVTDDRQPEFHGEGTPGDTIVITVAPTAPSIESVTDDVGVKQGALVNGGLTDDPSPTLSGKAEAGSTVAVYDNGTWLGKVVADAEGKWSLTPTTPLAEGEHKFTVTATDKAGNTSTPSAEFVVTTDYTPADYSKLAITGVEDDVGGITGNVASGATTDDSRPVISGTGTAGNTIVVMVKDSTGNHKLNETTVGADGKWTLSPTTPLLEGSNEFTAIEIDPAGNATAPSAPYTVILDSVPPSVPVIQNVQDDVGIHTGMLQKGDVTDDAKPTIIGTAQAGNTVKIYDNGTKIGEVVADPSGKWSFTPETPLAGGQHNIVATATNAVGQTSDATGVWNFVLDTTPPGLATGQEALDDVGAKQGTLTSGDTTDDNQPEFKGKAEPGATVNLYDGDTKIGTAVADPDGNWSITPTTPLGDGAHSLTTEVVDPAGNSSGKGPALDITVDTSKVEVSISKLVDDQGTVKGPITANGVTDDTRPEIQGTGKAGSTIKVYDGATLVGETVVKADGTWTLTPTAELGQGAHAITATATDKAGNVSEPTAAFHFTVDTVAPTAPSIESVTDDVGAKQGALVNGGVTDDPSPTLSGIRVHSGDFAHIDGGLGIDTLVMHGKAMHIDLSALGPKVQGVEKFDLGSGGNTLALSTHDVLAGGARDMVVADGKVQMLVNGANGEVDLLGGTHGDDGWTQGSNATVGGVTYHVYTNLAGTAELLVEDKVHVTIL